MVALAVFAAVYLAVGTVTVVQTEWRRSIGLGGGTHINVGTAGMVEWEIPRVVRATHVVL